MSAPKVKRFKKAESLSLPAQTFIKTQILAVITYPALFLAVGIASLSADLSEEYMFYAAVLSFAAASFVCAAYVGKKLHKNGLITGLLFCLPENFIVMLISLISNSFKFDFTAAVSMFILVVSSMLGGVVSVNTSTKPKIKVK